MEGQSTYIDSPILMHEKTARSLPSAKAVPACWAFKAQFRGSEQCAAMFLGALAASNSIRCHENNTDYGTNAGICARFAGAGAEGGHDQKGQRRRQGIARRKKGSPGAEGEGENHRRQPRYAQPLYAGR